MKTSHFIFFHLWIIGLSAANASQHSVLVSKWGRFETSFRSSLSYTNPVQQAELDVVFTSPLGETRRVYGFWDGGKSWRVRFSPDQPGRWTFKTICSDTANKGLHNRSGELLCTSATGQSRFNLHGPVRVALDHRHFEHADGTPFFWLADTVWSGAVASRLEDWDLYARTRAAQQFDVAQWAVVPGLDNTNEAAFTGAERIAINLAFFKKLDAKLETLSRAGMLSAIAPIMEMDSTASLLTSLPEDQATLLLRYVVARWGAGPVAWVLAFDGDPQTNKVGRWKRIGRAVFAETAHAPVILYPGGTLSLLDEFRDQNWVDAFECQIVTDFTDEALKWAFDGPLAKEWMKEPVRPLLPLLPFENGTGPQSKRRFSSDQVRRAVFWSLSLSPPAGVSYGADGVVNWQTSPDGKGGQSVVPAQAGRSSNDDLPLWHKAMFMPAAKWMQQLAKFAGCLDYWRLEPRPAIVANQPGSFSASRQAVAMGTQERVIVYVPEDRTIEVSTAALPLSPSVTWHNPRTGETSPAVAVVGERTCQFPTPDAGDWLLVMKAGR